jgi:hypothetical protein
MRSRRSRPSRPPEPSARLETFPDDGAALPFSGAFAGVGTQDFGDAVVTVDISHFELHDIFVQMTRKMEFAYQ